MGHYTADGDWTDSPPHDEADVVRRLHGTTDAQVWAEEFMKVYDQRESTRECPVDEGLMLGWFANAIETGRAAGVMSVDESFRRVAEAWERVTGKPLTEPEGGGSG